MRLFSPAFKTHRVKKSAPVLLLDLGSESVKAVLFRTQEGKKIILNSSLEYIDEFGVWNSDFQNGPQLDFRLQITKKFAAKVINDVLKDAEEPPGFFIVAPPPAILRSFVIATEVQRGNQSIRIGGREEKLLLAQAQEQAKKILFKKMGLSGKDIVFSDSKLLGVSIDGYKVSSLRNFTGKKILLNFLLFFTDSRHQYEAFLRKILRDVGKIKIRPGEFISLAEALCRISNFMPDGIYLDIGGSVTQTLIIIDGRLVFSGVFERGGMNFSEELSQRMGCDLPRARILKEDYAAGLLSQDLGARIKKELIPVVYSWLEDLKKLLPQDLEVLPNSIFIFGGGSLQPEIKECLSSADWKTSVILGLPNVKILAPADLPHMEAAGHKTIQQFSPQNTSSLLLCYSG